MDEKEVRDNNDNDDNNIKNINKLFLNENDYSDDTDDDCSKSIFDFYKE